MSRTPSSHSSMLVVVKSSGASVRRAPVREVAEWLFGLDNEAENTGVTRCNNPRPALSGLLRFSVGQTTFGSGFESRRLHRCAWVSETVCSVLPASASTVVTSFPAHTLYHPFRGEHICK